MRQQQKTEASTTMSREGDAATSATTEKTTPLAIVE